MRSGVYLFFTSISVFLTVSLGCIRHTEIGSQDTSLVFLDSFQFTGKSTEVGRIQLDVSKISLFSNFTTTTVAFFIVPRNQGIRRRWTNTSQCYIDTNPMVRYPVEVLYRFDEFLAHGSKSRNQSLNIVYNVIDPGEWELFFQNCMFPELRVSMIVRSAMFYETTSATGAPPTRSYISSTLIPNLGFYIVLLLTYLFLVGNWVDLSIKRNRWHVSSIYCLMLVIVALKVISIILDLISTYTIVKAGGESLGLSLFIRSFFSDFFKEIQVPTVAMFIASGRPWNVSKTKSYRIKDKIMMACITVCVFTSTLFRLVFMGTWLCAPTDSFTMVMFRWLDFFVPMVMTFPSFFHTIRHILRGREAEGKPAPVLRIFTRMETVCGVFILYSSIKYLAVSIVQFLPWLSYGYTWKVVFLGEVATLLFYVFIGCIFWPHTQDLIFSDHEQNEALQKLNFLLAGPKWIWDLN